jgi:hypothetical protein
MPTTNQYRSTHRILRYLSFWKDRFLRCFCEFQTWNRLYIFIWFYSANLFCSGKVPLLRCEEMKEKYKKFYMPLWRIISQRVRQALRPSVPEQRKGESRRELLGSRPKHRRRASRSPIYQPRITNKIDPWRQNPPWVFIGFIYIVG